MSARDGVTVSGGGAIRVDTASMLEARRVLEIARGDLQRLAPQVADCVPLAPAGSLQRASVQEAHDAVATAMRHADRMGAALEVAAQRYGETEASAAAAERALGAAWASTLGTAARSDPVVGALAALLSADVALGVPMLAQLMREGRVQPQLDAWTEHDLALVLSSSDDLLRAFLGKETPDDLVHDDPASSMGTETIAAGAAWLWPHTGMTGAAVPAVTRTRSRAVSAPVRLEDLAERLPDGAEAAGQVRIERYDSATGTRWIVYSAGTVTFAPSLTEPFDMESNLRGVGNEQGDSELAVREAMRQAGVGPDDPVLFVGHSQGALNVLRIAESGDYTVGGVVEFGGPTQQIATPDSMPRLSFRHDEDLVPNLGGAAAAATGAVVVTRSLPLGGASPLGSMVPLAAGFPSHDMTNYSETVRLAEASGAPQVERLERRTAAFFGGAPGTTTRYHAVRVTGPHAPTRAEAATPHPTR